MTGKMYSRKKVIVLRLMQVIVSHPKSEFQFEKPIDQNLLITIRKGTKECMKRPLYPLSHVVSFEKLSPSYKSFLISLNNIHITTTLSEALSKENWRQAINAKMEALEKNKTLEMVDLLVGENPVGCKWVYIVQGKIGGKEYTQIYDVDYLETFAPISKMNTVIILLSLIANYN
ncbi:hypothetical protein AAG906_016874 [Vitis piasezkii]